MTARSMWCGIVLIVTAILATPLLVSRAGGLQQDQKLPSGAPMPDMASMMKKMFAVAKPGEPHKKLDYFVGNWDTTTKMWMEGPSGPAMESKGTASNKWVLNNHFLLEETEGDMMIPDEQMQMKKVNHQGMGLLGYDYYRNLYIGTWADSMSTTILDFAGMCDQAGKVFTYYGQMDEPMLDVRGRTVKYVTRIVDQDHFTFEIYDLVAGDNYKVLQVDYARKK